MSEKKSFAGWWIFILVLLVVTIGVLGATGVAGRIVDVVVEREVFERSFQYQEGKSDQIATYRAQMAELEGHLANPELSAGGRANINAQLSAIRIQLNTAIQLQNKSN